jgi:hypothetical protein
MFDSPVLDVIIGIVFIYLLYSLLASLVSEIISTNLGLRARVLEKALQRMLNDDKDHHFWTNFGNFFSNFFKKVLNKIQHVIPLFNKFILDKEKTLAGKFYEQPLIKYLGVNKFFKKPSYMGKENFSKNLYDMLKEMGQEVLHREDATNLEKIQAALGIGQPEGKAHPLIEPQTLKYLRSLLDDANNDLDKFRTHTENWFDYTMLRASGWYKNNIQFVLFTIGMVLAITFNVDTVEIITKLSKDDKARDQMVQMASNYVKTHNVVKTKAGKDSIPLDESTYTKRMDSLTKVVDSLIAKDIKNANGLVAIGWDTPQTFALCMNTKTDKNISEDKKLCKECLAFVKGKDQKNTDAVSRAQRFFYLTCTIFGNPMKMFGFLITALAISLGAPFWFDMLKKIMEMRGTGGKGDNQKNSNKSTDNASVSNVKRAG